MYGGGGFNFVMNATMLGTHQYNSVGWLDFNFLLYATLY